ADVGSCVVSHSSGDLQNKQPNYQAKANDATFAFLVPMKSLHDNIVLVAAGQGGEVKEAYAALKVKVTREGDGPLAAEKVMIQWPLTGYQNAGNTYGIIGMSHEQGVPVGIVFSSGGQAL